MPIRLYSDPRFRSPTAVPARADVLPLTIGYAPPDPLFIHGRYSVISNEARLTRMFLFGEPTDPVDWKTVRGQGLTTGQEREQTKVLQGFEVRVNRKPYIFSREVVQACSRGHLDVGQIEAMTNALALLAQKKPDELGDAAVTLQQVLVGLLGFPTVGYAINPPILMDRNSDLRVEGLPDGMRLFLTGHYLEDAR